jgi:hypothetical protein
MLVLVTWNVICIGRFRWASDFIFLGDDGCIAICFSLLLSFRCALEELSQPVYDTWLVSLRQQLWQWTETCEWERSAHAITGALRLHLMILPREGVYCHSRRWHQRDSEPIDMTYLCVFSSVSYLALRSSNSFFWLALASCNVVISWLRCPNCSLSCKWNTFCSMRASGAPRTTSAGLGPCNIHQYLSYTQLNVSDICPESICHLRWLRPGIYAMICAWICIIELPSALGFKRLVGVLHRRGDVSAASWTEGEGQGHGI